MSKQNRINFTEKTLATLPVPKTGTVVYYDTGSLDGLCVHISYGGAKTYFAYLKFQNMPRRVKIGRVGQIKIAEARAHEYKECALHGEDPATERRDALNDMTLGHYYNNIYLPQHSMVYKKPKTVYDNNITFKKHLKRFHNRQMRTITQQEVRQLHNSIQRNSGLYTANRTLSLLRHMYNKAYELGYPRRLENPAQHIKQFKEKSRVRYLSQEELQRFFEALKYSNTVFRNYVLLSLFLAQRRSNMLSLRWSDVVLENGFVRFANTKNGDDVNIPVTTHAMDLLIQMRNAVGDSPWLYSQATVAKADILRSQSHHGCRY